MISDSARSLATSTTAAPGGAVPAGFEPIAVVGMGCRFAPDIGSPDKFWAALMSRLDATADLPPQRWEPWASLSPHNTAVLRRTTSRGAYLDDITGFDAQFFGISPREAEYMDPQQRILLEVAWEALEHAGIAPTSLAGSDAGVFLGSTADDYLRRMLEDLPRIGPWSGMGGQASVAAGRISYLLDLRGPCLAIDTACSSSLTALHVGCQSLRLHEATVAIIAGVNVLAGPGYSIMLDGLRAISRDGRSKPYSADADGYGRGEGVGVIICKRLSDAHRDGDRVLAVIKGTSAAQDGRTQGIMVPNRAAQEQVMRLAYQQAGIAPQTVDYVEGHGTGTAIGDPIEVEAIAAVVGPGRPAGQPCLLGSVKGNIGHLEAGAGVSSVIKTVLALQHGVIPPTLHCTDLNPAVDWQDLAVEVVRTATAWPQTGHPRRAGVSGLGYGGSIVHVLLEQAPDTAVRRTPDPAPLKTPWVFPISAASEDGLQETAGRLADWLARPEPTDLRSVGHTLARRRAHLAQRATVVTGNHDELVMRLRHLAAGTPAARTATARILPEAGLVWVFSGHGSQWPGMGSQLLSSEPAFAAVIDTLQPIFLAELGLPLRETLTADDLGGTDHIQAMTFAVQVALAHTWRSYGLQPAAIIGYSVGEIAAAVTAGALDLSEAARLTCRRSALLRKVAGRGAMAMVNLPFPEVAARLTGRPQVTAAIEAAPESTVISGTPAAVHAAADSFTAEGLLVRHVACDVAFHSPQVAPLAADLVAAADLTPATPAIPLYGTALADPRSGAARDAQYWAANLRNVVRFAPAVQAAADDGHRLFLEISAHPVVAHFIAETLTHRGIEEAFVGHTLRRGQDERQSMLTTLGALHCHGARIDWSILHPDGDLVDLPTAAFQRRPYWLHTTPHPPAQGHDPDSHTLLGTHTTVNAATGARLWRTYLDGASRPYPGDPTAYPTVPAAVIVSTFLAATPAPGPNTGLREVTFNVPLNLTEPLQVHVLRQDGIVHLTSRPAAGPHNGQADDAAWVEHATAAFSTDRPRPQPADASSGRPLPPPYEHTSALLGGTTSAGRAFGWEMTGLRHGDGHLIARIDIGEQPVPSWAPVLDAAMTLAAVALARDPATTRPVRIAAVTVHAPPPATAVITIRTIQHAGEGNTDISITTGGGRPAADLRGVALTEHDDDLAVTANPQQIVHELQWRPLEGAATGAADVPSPPAVVVGAGPHGLIDRLESAGLRCLRAAAPEALRHLVGGSDAPSLVLVAPPLPQPGEPVHAAAHRFAWQLIETLQHLTRIADAPRLWCLTQGVRVGTPDSLAHAPLWGIGRVIAGEHPELWGGIIDLDPHVGDGGAVAKRLLALLRSSVREDVIALAPDHTAVARLTAIDRQPSRPVGPVIRPDGTYLITGGLGALGLRTARWLVGRGARRLVLAGRRGLPARHEWGQAHDLATLAKINAVRDLEALGATVRVVSLDITDREQAARALDPVALDLPPIRGVVHAAGAVAGQLLRNVDEHTLRAVMGPKVNGALVLHDLFPPGAVDFFVLFSSAGQLIGESGSATYAAANAFLDALATHRRRDGHTDTTSFAWAAWRGLGMAAGAAADGYSAEAEALGVADITEQQALRAWEFAARYDLGYCSVMRITPIDPSTARPPLLSELKAPAYLQATAPDPTCADWSQLPPQELRQRLTEEVGRQFVTEMRLDPDSLDVRRSLLEFGLDSVMTVAIRARLQRRLRITVPAGLLFDHPTVLGIAEYLADKLTTAPSSDDTGQEARPADQPVGAPPRHDHDHERQDHGGPNRTTPAH
jgi:6-methylsalicylic acid synthase